MGLPVLFAHISSHPGLCLMARKAVCLLAHGPVTTMGGTRGLPQSAAAQLRRGCAGAPRARAGSTGSHLKAAQALVPAPRAPQRRACGALLVTEG